MTRLPAAIFCDFDGTISRRDVGYNLFRHFSGGKNEALLPDWKAGRLSTRDCLLQEAAMVRAGEDEILAFLEQFELDRGFVTFEKLCRQSNVDLIIVSDGLDFYIRHILRRYGQDHLPVLANSGTIHGDRLIVGFVHDNHSCRRCGSCKGERMAEYRQRRGSPVQLIFVGDGYSDTCATAVADVIFAKKDLERFCVANHIAHYTYDDFNDVARQLVTSGYLKNS
ncbi:MAG TPA: MtnX-like HAD-IB family phosphatase [Candidatus Deferrimicrobium sp.]|nr:MtnX-like HAD-IB family phosphatase [Candidatus Deferrimicrobium sp.]